MVVDLEQGPNQLRFRLADDKGTAVDWILVFTPEVALATATLVPATAEVTQAPPSTPVPTPKPTLKPTPKPTTKPTATPKPTAAPPPPNEYIVFGDGTWDIGGDIPARTYRTRHATDGCYWARLSGYIGDVDDIIANEFGSGYMVVTVKAHDVAFETDGCGNWSSNLSQVTDSDTRFGEGTFIVGVDMRSGTYRSSQGDGCYWARLSGFGGTINDIITNHFGDGVATVTIRSTDAGFTSSSCGGWVRQ